ncbi:MAG: hypothetical protein LBH29_00770 [Elusimicrobiota bacterium]|jgi:hypothetical protein|nr:hypothetical protein [Elusimicrobiota bacterium]
MKKIFLMLCAVFVLSANAYSAEPTKTAGSLNGHFWNSIADNQKVVFLVGFNDGLLSGTAGLAAIMKMRYDNINNTKEQVSSLLDKFQLEATYNDAKDYLNDFYKSPQNRVLPIKDVLQYFASLTRGQSTKEEIDKKSASDIRWYAQNQDNY